LWAEPNARAVSRAAIDLVVDWLVVLLLVRHGQTDANALGLLLGRADPPLNEVGERQSRAVAQALPRPDRVISSPLRRARATAAAFGAPVEIDERWVELDYGDYDGRPVASVEPDVWSRWRRDPAFSPASGESLVDLGRRVHEACVELSDAAAVETIVIVTHVSPVKAAITWALDVPDAIAWRMYVEDASVSRIDIESDGPVLRWFNRDVAPGA
jgi:broad specificity phosphatase PhoE